MKQQLGKVCILKIAYEISATAGIGFRNENVLRIKWAKFRKNNISHNLTEGVLRISRVFSLKDFNGHLKNCLD